MRTVIFVWICCQVTIYCSYCPWLMVNLILLRWLRFYKHKHILCMHTCTHNRYMYVCTHTQATHAHTHTYTHVHTPMPYVFLYTARAFSSSNHHDELNYLFSSLIFGRVSVPTQLFSSDLILSPALASTSQLQVSLYT